MPKTFVLDTSVFIYEPNCIETFDDNTVIVPAAVLVELDNKKNTDYNARKAIKNLEKYRLKGDLRKGISITTGGKLRVDFYSNNLDYPKEFDFAEIDNLILGVAYQAKHKYNEPEVTLISKDINMRIKANSLGINADDYRHYKQLTETESQNTVYLTSADIDLFYDKKTIPIEAIPQENRNQDYLIIKEPTSGKSLLARRKQKMQCFTLLDSNKKYKNHLLGIFPLNAEQIFLADALVSKEIDIVFVKGRAGTGKTLLSLAFGLSQALNGNYTKVVVMRSPIPMGQDIGFLPGDVDEKLSIWMKPIYDNLTYILSNSNAFKTNDTCNTTISYLKESGMLEIEGSMFTRGRTFNDCFILIDEAQNLTPHEIKTLITRVGNNCKIVLTGDPEQIDVPFLTAEDNGLMYASKQFKNANIPFALTVNMYKTERSRVVKAAVEIL